MVARFFTRLKMSRDVRGRHDVNGQVKVPTGGQLKVPTLRVDQRALVAAAPFVLASRIR
jgi:hypothetical protein